MDRHGRRTIDAGVSESIGFLLIFTMVITGIGLVTLYGYPMLLQTQTSADKQIMEKNMIVLQNDIKSLTYKTVPYKETAMNVGGGALTVYNTSDLSQTSTLSIRDSSGSILEPAFHSGDLRYVSTSAGEKISLQNGAVLIRPVAAPGSTMLAQPRWFFDSATNTMVINLISINSTAPFARAGVGTVQMTMGLTNYTVDKISTGGSACLAYTPASAEEDYSTAWDNYFINTMKMQKNAFGPCGGEYTLPLDPAKDAYLIIKKYDVQILSL